MIWAMANPRANISARMSHRFWSPVICVRIKQAQHESDQASGDVPAGADRG